MRHYSIFSFFIIITLFPKTTISQQKTTAFDPQKARQEAIKKGIPNSDLDGYVDYLKHEHNSKQLPVLDLGTIYKTAKTIAAPLSPQNSYCPNAGFEQQTFANWTGGFGFVSTGPFWSNAPIYNQTNANITNPSGNNVGLTNFNNYHTIMTTPPTNSVYPNCIGWDSIAVANIGGQIVSEIPVVNPVGGPSSVRLNGALAGFRASKLNYNLALNPNNKNFTISYAIVLSSDNSPHAPYQQPYFSVKVTDQNGNMVAGCAQYSVTIHPDMTDPSSFLYDPTWSKSALSTSTVNIKFYRKWQTYALDFSNDPSITSVNIEFYVGGCSLNGHFGYAYVDAECGQGGAVSSFCAGSTTSILSAPNGYSSYQWIGPSGNIPVADGGNTPTATITPVIAGQVFTCNVSTSSGCLSSFQTTVSPTTVSITGISAVPSCINLNNGGTSVSATGSSSGYSYQWFNSSNTSISTAQNPSGLGIGTYSVVVSSLACGSASASVNVTQAAPDFYTSPAPYCGNTAWIKKPGGSNYKWYSSNPTALINGANSPTLTINTPTNGAIYYLVYTNANGCNDSIKYNLVRKLGGSISTTDIESVCPNYTDASAIVNLQTTEPPVYSYTVVSSSGYSSIVNNSTSKKDSLNSLAEGTYSVTVFDGLCIYESTFTITAHPEPIASFTSTPPSPVETDATINFSNTSLINTGSIISTNWNFGNGNVASTNNPSHAYSVPGTYSISLIVTSDNGCKDTAFAVYQVDGTIRIPNVVTPNGDNANDLLKFKNLEFYPNNTLTIINRWGKKVFEQNNYKNDWDGSSYADGTYFFILRVSETEEKNYNGYFQLIH